MDFVKTLLIFYINLKVFIILIPASYFYNFTLNTGISIKFFFLILLLESCLKNVFYFLIALFVCSIPILPITRLDILLNVKQLH